MTWTLFALQALNGLQFGLILFLIAAGLTLIARARGGRFDVFTHPERLLG